MGRIGRLDQNVSEWSKLEPTVSASWLVTMPWPLCGTAFYVKKKGTVDWGSRPSTRLSCLLNQEYKSVGSQIGGSLTPAPLPGSAPVSRGVTSLTPGIPRGPRVSDCTVGDLSLESAGLLGHRDSAGLPQV